MQLLDQTMIDRYLEEVDVYLHVDRAQRQRVLDEIQGHLHDAVEAHIVGGAQPAEAMERAVEELGSPAEVAMQFSPAPSPSRSVRGWRRWAPLALPAVHLIISVALIAWSLSWLQGGLTLGEQRLQTSYMIHTAIVAALATGTYVAIRYADRDPAWRRAAWFFAGLTVVFMVVTVWS
jgi:hypothetical protein